MKFEWDTDKEKANVIKHGLSFEKASYVFADPYALSIFDNDHSDDEDRWLLLGKSLNDLIIVVAHTFRNEDGVEVVRIISARKATKNEQQVYFERLPK